MAFEVLSRNDLFDTTSVTRVLLFVITSCVTWILIRRWLEKPHYKKPPGPRGVPFLGYLPFLGKDSFKTLWRLKDKYGDIMGLYMGRKYTVVLSNYNVTKEVLSHPGALNRPEGLFNHIPRIGFQVENGEKWVEQRRFCMQTARDLGIGKHHWEELIMEETMEFVRELRGMCDRPVEISHALLSSVSSNILSLLIGKRLDKKREEDVIQLSLDFIHVAFSYMGATFPTTVVPGLRKFCQAFRIAGHHRVREIVRRFSDFLQGEIHRHKTSKTLGELRDFVNMYLERLSELSEAKNSKHYFSESMLEGNMAIMLLGATDTISSSLGWLLRLMAKHQDVQEKVHRELMDVLGKEGRAKYEERNKVSFTFAVVMEAQRISSIVPLSSTRITTQDIHINGFVIPRGTEIFSNFWGLHNDPAYWEEPEQFRPERFLTEDGTKLRKTPPSFVPFSIGKRNCPGETIANMEILFYFSEIMKAFRVSTETEPEFEIVDGLVTRLTPQTLILKERK